MPSSCRGVPTKNHAPCRFCHPVNVKDFLLQKAFVDYQCGACAAAKAAGIILQRVGRQRGVAVVELRMPSGSFKWHTVCPFGHEALADKSKIAGVYEAAGTLGSARFDF